MKPILLLLSILLISSALMICFDIPYPFQSILAPPILLEMLRLSKRLKGGRK